MRQTRRFLFLLTLLSVATFGKAQTSFDPEEGCLNVVEVSYAKGVGEYGDGGLSANYLHEKFINERFSIGAGIGYSYHKNYNPFISVHIISFLTSGFLRLSICALEDSPCLTRIM